LKALETSSPRPARKNIVSAIATGWPRKYRWTKGEGTAQANKKNKAFRVAARAISSAQPFDGMNFCPTFCGAVWDGPD
jgi:hypothetical protein